MIKYFTKLKNTYDACDVLLKDGLQILESLLNILYLK